MGIFTTSPRTVSVGNFNTATGNNTYERDFIDAFGAWTSYTPTWGSNGTAPDIGNGTLAGFYTQIQKSVFFRCAVTFGSTSTYGTGSYTLTLPVTPVSGIRWNFTGWAVDGSNVTPIFGLANASTTVALIAASGNVSPTHPYTFGSGDSLHISGVYEAA